MKRFTVALCGLLVLVFGKACAELSYVDLKGTHALFPEEKAHLLPAHGCAWWNTKILTNLLLYGDESHATVQLIKVLFHKPMEALVPTTAEGNLAASFGPAMIGAIIGALEKYASDPQGVALKDGIVNAIQSVPFERYGKTFADVNSLREYLLPKVEKRLLLIMNQLEELGRSVALLAGTVPVGMKVTDLQGEDELMYLFGLQKSISALEGKTNLDRADKQRLAAYTRDFQARLGEAEEVRAQLLRAEEALAVAVAKPAQETDLVKKGRGRKKSGGNSPESYRSVVEGLQRKLVLLEAGQAKFAKKRVALEEKRAQFEDLYTSLEDIKKKRDAMFGALYYVRKLGEGSIADIAKSIAEAYEECMPVASPTIETEALDVAGVTLEHAQAWQHLSPRYAPFTVHNILLAMLWAKAAKQNDLVAYADKTGSSSGVKLLSGQQYDIKEWDEIVDKLLQKSAIFDEKDIAGEDFEKILFCLMAVNLMPGAPYMPVEYGNAYFKGVTFADCGETTLRNLFNAVLYDRESGAFDIAKLTAAFGGDKVNPQLQVFYESNISSLAHVMTPAVRNRWADVVCGIPDFPFYSGAKGTDIAPSLEALNLMIKKLVGVDTIEELLVRLGASDVQVMPDEKLHGHRLLFSIKGQVYTAVLSSYHAEFERIGGQLSKQLDKRHEKLYQLIPKLALCDRFSDEQNDMRASIIGRSFDQLPMLSTGYVQETYVPIATALDGAEKELFAKQFVLSYLAPNRSQQDFMSVVYVYLSFLGLGEGRLDLNVLGAAMLERIIHGVDNEGLSCAALVWLLQNKYNVQDSRVTELVQLLIKKAGDWCLAPLLEMLVKSKDKDYKREVFDLWFAIHNIDPKEVFYGHLLREAARVDVDIVAELLHRGVDPRMADANGHTALREAAIQGKDDVVALLLADGRSDPNISPMGPCDDPLYYALELGHAGVVALLLADPRVDVYVRTSEGGSCFHSAINGGNADTVRILLRDGRIDPNSVDNAGITPLGKAAEKSSVDIVKVLLQDSRVLLDEALVKAARAGEYSPEVNAIILGSAPQPEPIMLRHKPEAQRPLVPPVVVP